MLNVFSTNTIMSPLSFLFHLIYYFNVFLNRIFKRFFSLKVDNVTLEMISFYGRPWGKLIYLLLVVTYWLLYLCFCCFWLFEMLWMRKVIISNLLVIIFLFLFISCNNVASKFLYSRHPPLPLHGGGGCYIKVVRLPYTDINSWLYMQ